MGRATQLGPIIFLLIGAGVGLSVGMLTHNKSPYQVHFDESLPLMFLGSFAGVLVGCGVTGACVCWPWLVRPLGLVSTALLCAAFAAPLGWIVGTGVASDRLPHAEVEEEVGYLPPLGLAVGASVGATMGLALGVMQLSWDQRKRNAARHSLAS
jgi:hypothetical protein